MKLTDKSLSGFLSILPDYERLPFPARRALASIDSLWGSLAVRRFENSYEALVNAGFLVPEAKKIRCTVAEDRRDFIRILYSLDRHPIFTRPTAEVLEGYIEELLDWGEQYALVRSRYGDRSVVLYSQVTSPDWITGFLKAKNNAWEEPYKKPDLPVLLGSAEIFATAQQLIQMLLDRAEPISLRELSAAWPNSKVLASAMRACLRYALAYWALTPQALEPVLGLWPAIAKPAYTGPPRAVTPDEKFEAAFLMEDMTAIAVAAAAEPLRVKDGGELYAKNLRDLAKGLRRMPAWVEQALDFDSELRVLTAFSFTKTFQLVRPLGYGSLEISNRGRRWLELSPGQRLRVLVDGILDCKQTIAGFADLSGTNLGRIAPQVYIRTNKKPPPDIEAATLRPYSELAGDSFFPLSEIVSHSRAQDNPLLALYERDKNTSFALSNYYFQRGDAHSLEEMWTNVVQGFLRIRLFPLGCVRIGSNKDGIAVAITPVGRYYLGQTEDWPAFETNASQVLVQPNFEVTFLGESPLAEAELARFAERRGQHMGALFQITKKSIFAAAAAGMKAEDVLAILERTCTLEIPGNVRREITGWFGQCREVRFENTVLIRCPDRETAARVLGLTKGKAVALTDTILEYNDPSNQRAWLIKKLKETGVMVRGRLSSL